MQFWKTNVLKNFIGNFVEVIRYIYQFNVHFRIKHFVGPVSYDCREFVSRNRDHLDRNLSQAMFECQHPLLKILFPEGKNFTFDSYDNQH